MVKAAKKQEYQNMPESYNNHILCDNLLYNTKDRLDRYPDFGNSYCYICL